MTAVAGYAPELIAFAAVVFLIAGTIKGVAGIGLPTAAAGMLTLMMDVRAAIALIVFPSLLSNAWQVWRTGGANQVLHRFWIYIACLMVTIALVSTFLTATVPVETIMLVLGCVIVIFSLSSLTWSPPYLPERYDSAGQTASGLASGLLGGMTGIWAPPMVTYLMARRVEKDEFVAASGVMIFLGTVPLIGGFWSSGIVTGGSAFLSILLTAPAIAGFALGERLRRNLDAVRFRRVVLVIFLLMGLNLIRRAVL